MRLPWLRWEQVDFEVGLLYVRRVKHGIPSVHPLRAPELRALRQLQRESTLSPYLFVTERGSPMTATEFRKILTHVAQLSSLPFSVHHHMLRHVCGYKLVNEGHDTRSIQHYLGHKNIQHMVRYTELAASLATKIFSIAIKAFIKEGLLHSIRVSSSDSFM